MSDEIDTLQRIWTNLLARPTGPEAFRFYLQPAMASIFAIRDGIKDARLHQTPYLRSIFREPETRMARLKEGTTSTSRIILLGVVMDVIYQYRVFDTFYPFEAVVITFLLAFLPYLLVRGPTDRIVRWRSEKKERQTS